MAMMLASDDTAPNQGMALPPGRVKSAWASQQRGAALLMAMIIVTLVATLAAAMVWQQWRAVQVEAAERARVQSAWILSGALDWARLILREDARTGGADHLGEPWAVPLAEARLSTFLAADKNNTDDGPDAFLSGSIIDVQSRYNLTNLLDDQGRVVQAEQQVLQRLFDAVGVSPDVAVRIANGLSNSWTGPRSAEKAKLVTNPPLAPQSIQQLAWLEIDEDTLRRLEPHVVLLPVPTPVNVNTASREVLSAVINGLDLGTAERLTQVRQRTPFRSLEDLRPHLPQGPLPDSRRVGISSTFFEVRGRLRLGDKSLEESSLVERRGLEIVPLQRNRVSRHSSNG
jgi:general secretion pathway protein K